MCDTPAKPTQRFGERFLEVMAALDEVNQPGRGASVETFLDACGQKRRFAMEIFGGDGATFLTAREQRDDGLPGLLLVERFDEGSQPAPRGALWDRIRVRLATRDLARDPDNGRLQLLTGDLRAQLTTDPERPDGPPAVLIDDLRLSWEELGLLLSAYEGFALNVRVCDD